MKLRIRFLKWSTGILGAMLNKKTAERLGIKAIDRLSIKTFGRNPKEIFTFVNTIGELVMENEIAISSETKERLGLRTGQKVDVNLAQTPESLDYIKKKLDRKTLSQKEISTIIKDINDNCLSEAEIALFISAMYEQGTTLKETIYLINAILATGDKLAFNKKIIADKHSIGGIPGNRTTPIIVSICAAAGLIIPKNSSRAITSAAGTADVIEAIAKVVFSAEELKKIVEKTNACMAWGGSLKMVPADAKMIQVEKKLNIDPEAQLLASIMSKKLAVGSTHILIDIPYGKTAKVDKLRALKLKRKFEILAKYFKKKIEVVLTDGSRPIGSGIGPILELRDVISILENKLNAPKDLKEKSLFLSGKLLELTGKEKKGRGIIMAKEILESGRALAKFKEIIKAQGGSFKIPKPAKFKKEIMTKASGKVIEIDNKKINYLARLTGAPNDKAAGLFLYCNKGNKLKKKDKIIAIYSESQSRLKQALDFYNKEKPIRIK